MQGYQSYQSVFADPQAKRFVPDPVYFTAPVRRYEYEAVGRQEPLHNYPTSHTVIHSGVDTLESDLRSELTILRHHIYELRRQSDLDKRKPQTDLLRAEFESLHHENWQLRQEIAQLRDHMATITVLNSARSAPEAPRPEPYPGPVPRPIPPPFEAHVLPPATIIKPQRHGQRPVLGVELKQRGDLLYAHRVTPGGPCDVAGVQPGDVIRRWEGNLLTSKLKLDQLLARTSPGDVILLTVQRHGYTMPLNLVIGGSNQNWDDRLGSIATAPSSNELEKPRRRFSLPSAPAPKQSKPRRISLRDEAPNKSPWKSALSHSQPIDIHKPHYLF